MREEIIRKQLPEIKFLIPSTYVKLSSKAEFKMVASNAKITLTAYGGHLIELENDVDTVRGYVNGLKIKLQAEELLKQTNVEVNAKDLVTYAYLELAGSYKVAEGIEIDLEKLDNGGEINLVSH